MTSISTNDNILRFETLQTKFDLGIVSNSLIALLGSYEEARIIQQLHYWMVKGYGKIIDGLRWIYKPIKEWIEEVFPSASSWRIRKAIVSLESKNILLKEHLYHEHHGHNFAPKNRTYYYSLNYEGLEEFARQYTQQAEARPAHGEPSSPSFLAETRSIVRFVNDTNQFCESSKKRFFPLSKNKTKNTSIENITNNKTHPQAGGKISQNDKLEKNQEENLSSTFELNPTLEEETNLSQQILKEEAISPDVDEKINIKNKYTNEFVTSDELLATDDRPRKTPRGTRSKRKEAFALWNSPQQRERFRKDVTAAIASGVGRARNITALVAHVMNEVRQGHSHTYWEEWIAEKPIGSSEKQEWEASTGKPYPKFVEYLLEKLIYPQESREQALFRVGKILSDREQAELYWRDFKRNIEALRQQSEQMEQEGKTPTVPTWFVDRVDVSVERASESAQKVTQLTPNQRDWLEEKLPESEKLISGMNCPLLPPAEEITPEDEDLEFCFDGITLEYLENQARKIASLPGLVGILLPDFRAAMSQANSAQREKIRSVISSIYPDLLNLI